MASLNKKLSKKAKEDLQRKKNISNAINTKPSADIKPLTMYEDGKTYTLTIDQIDLYDKNPRITKNPEYDAIYASLKADGFNRGALDVTQRPGDDLLKVFLMAGGNTRLYILKKLYEETGDKKYYYVTVIFRKWTSDFDCKASHHIENNTRGDTKFFEDALNIIEMKEIYEQENNINVSDKKFIAILKEKNLSGIGIDTLNRMRFAVERLWPVCPEILKSGIGSGKVNDIIKLEKHASTLHEEYFSNESTDDWDNKFDQALALTEKKFLQSGNYDYKELYYAVLDQLENDQVKRNRLDFLLDNLIRNNGAATLDPDLLTDDTTNSSADTHDNKQDASYSHASNPSTHHEQPSPPSTPPPANTNIGNIGNPETSDGSDGSDGSEVKPDITPSINNGDNQAGPNLSDIPIGYGDTEMLVSPGQQEINRILRGEQYDSGLVAAKSTVNTDGLILHKASAHQIGRQWDTAYMNHDDSVFNDIPISCHDVREYAPLPDSVNELRQIMFDKAYYFSVYAANNLSGASFSISPIESGVGFVVDDLPRYPLNKSTRSSHPRTGVDHKPYISFWVLLGFTDMLMLNHLKQFDLIKKYQPSGKLKDILLQPMNGYFEPVMIEINDGVSHSVTPDLITLFISNATPKQLQLFIELQLTYNRLMKAADYDIWSSTGRGVAL